MHVIRNIKQNKVIGSILSFGSATLLSSILTFLVGVATRNILGPEKYGYYLTISLAFTFIPLFQLGTLNAMNREVPFYFARNDSGRVQEIRNAAFSFLFTIPLFSVVILTLGGIILYFSEIDTAYKTGVMFTSLISVFLFLTSYIEMYYKSEQNFKMASKLVFIKSMSQSITTLILVKLIGYEGLYIGMLLALIIEVIVGRKTLQNLEIIFDIKKYKKLVRTGFPILLVGLVWSLMIASDRVIIALMMTPEDVGNYGVGMLVFSTMMLFPQVVGQVLYPKIVELYSQRKFIEISRYYWKVNRILSFIMAVIVLVGYFSLPFFIELLLPDYVEGTKAAQILFLGIYPLTLVGISANYFNATNNQRLYIIIQIISILINILCSITFLSFEKNIKFVAYGTAISFLIYFLLMNAYFLKKIHFEIIKIGDNSEK